MTKWESEKHKSWRMQGKTGKCGELVVGQWYSWTMMKRWAVAWDVRLVEAEIEVQRTIKRAELTSFLSLLKRVIGPVRVHVDNKGVIDGLRRG